MYMDLHTPPKMNTMLMWALMNKFISSRARVSCSSGSPDMSVGNCTWVLCKISMGS